MTAETLREYLEHWDSVPERLLSLDIPWTLPDGEAWLERICQVEEMPLETVAQVEASWLAGERLYTELEAAVQEHLKSPLCFSTELRTTSAPDS